MGLLSAVLTRAPLQLRYPRELTPYQVGDNARLRYNQGVRPIMEVEGIEDK